MFYFQLGLAASQAFRFDPGTALGLFATGCAPGGGASNAYSFLLDGDVSLSVTMTLISTLASFGKPKRLAFVLILS